MAEEKKNTIGNAHAQQELKKTENLMKKTILTWLLVTLMFTVFTMVLFLWLTASAAKETVYSQNFPELKIENGQFEINSPDQKFEKSYPAFNLYMNTNKDKETAQVVEEMLKTQPNKPVLVVTKSDFAVYTQGQGTAYLTQNFVNQETPNINITKAIQEKTIGQWMWTFSPMILMIAIMSFMLLIVAVLFIGLFYVAMGFIFTTILKWLKVSVSNGASSYLYILNAFKWTIILYLALKLLVLTVGTTWSVNAQNTINTIAVVVDIALFFILISRDIFIEKYKTNNVVEVEAEVVADTDKDENEDSKSDTDAK